MDLISRAWLKEAIHNFFNGLIHKVTEEDIQAYIEATPSVFEGMTNGETIKTIIPNIKTNEDKGYALIHCWIDSVIDGSTEVSMVCRREWWNAPYKGVSE